MSRSDILKEAEKIVNGDRENAYGTPEDNFSKIAGLWETYLSSRLGKNGFITATDVANMMILVKIARNASGHYKMDNWIDIAGYAACGGEIDFNRVKNAVESDTKKED